MKKVLAAILLVATVMTFGAGAISCSSGNSDDQLIAIFKEKYQLSYVLNEYIWGDGLTASEYDTESVGEDAYYVKVAEDAEYTTKADFVAAIKKVYVNDYVNDEIDQLLFRGYTDEGIASRYGEIDGVLSVNVKDSGNKIVGVGKFLPDTARVKKARGSVAVFTVTYERDGKQTEYEIMMRLEDGEWKFEAPTY